VNKKIKINMNFGTNTIQNREAVESAIAAATNEDALPYTSCHLLVNQGGTNDPTVSKLYSNITGINTVSATYMDEGLYLVTLGTSVLPTPPENPSLGKVLIFATNGTKGFVVPVQGDENSITISTYDSDGLQANSILYNCAIEIRVYS